MATDDLVDTSVTYGNSQNYTPGFHGGLGLGGLLSGSSILQPSPPSVGQYPLSEITSIGGQLPQLPFRPPGFGISPMPVRPDFGFRPGPIMGLQPAMPDYSSQFENFGETLGGFGEQLTGFGDQMTG